MKPAVESSTTICPAIGSRSVFDKLGLSPSAVTFHAGWFEQTFATYRGGPLAFAHVDADVYDSTRSAFEFLEQHLSDRAMVVLDDWEEWPGVRTAFDEYRMRTTRRLELQAKHHQQ